MESSKDKGRGESNQREERRNGVVKETPKGKSCKGYLYYSSFLKSQNSYPRCIGIPRTLPQVPEYVVAQTEEGASKDSRSLLEFYYACAGYSVYSTNLIVLNDKQKAHTELPVCFGLELLVDRKVADADAPPAPVHARSHNKEDVHGVPRPHVHNKPAHSSGDDFFNRFTRNANLVASGVARNMRRVGNYIKESVDDIFYPYRKRPK